MSDSPNNNELQKAIERIEPHLTDTVYSNVFDVALFQDLKTVLSAAKQLEALKAENAKMREALEQGLKVVSEIADIDQESRAGWAHKAMSEALSTHHSITTERKGN